MKKLVLNLLRRGGLFSLTRAVSAHMARILVYHNFAGATDRDGLSEAAAREQFKYLRRHFRVVPLSKIVEQLAAGKKLESRSVALTIDDGRRNCYELLFPLLKEFQLPATFFVVSSFIAGEDWLWTDKVLWLSEQPACPEELASHTLAGVFRSLNRMRPEVRNQRIDAWAANAGVSIPQRPPLKYAPCAWEELRKMAGSGLVEIGSHTATHPILSSITDQESWEELTESRRQIEEGVRRKVDSFCFPNGLPGDYRPSQVKQLVAAEYSCAVVADFGLVRNGTDCYHLPRIGMERKTQKVDIAKYLDGAAYYQSKLWPREMSDENLARVGE
jgi:peptidoglycan/xylan/chitin deacetylase (PgdA/CDA1 family)